MADGCALHRAFHRARTATRADTHAAQTQFVTHFFGVVVFDFADGVTTPADDQIRLAFVIENACIPQDVVHGIGNAAGLVQIKTLRAENRVMDIDDVA